MPVLDVAPSLLELMRRASSGGSLAAATAALSGSCVTTVLAAANYPESPRTGDVITLPTPTEGIVVFHAGTARDPQGRLHTSGGRVLAVSAVGATIDEARERSRRYAEQVEFAGKQLRTDIGWRESARRTPASARATGN